MGETVNLRQWKKRRARNEAKDVSAGNRAIHGLPKPLKQKLKSEAAKAAAQLDGHRLDQKSS
jgi:Domain of unknown function (DUF4169)